MNVTHGLAVALAISCFLLGLVVGWVMNRFWLDFCNETEADNLMCNDDEN